MALRLGRQKPQQRLHLEVTSYNAAAGAYEKGQQWPERLHLPQQTPQPCPEPGVISYNAETSAWTQGQQWPEVLLLLTHAVAGQHARRDNLKRLHQRVREAPAMARGALR